MSDTKPQITIYTDGGADPNPGPGGWAAILIHPQKERELSGGDPETTNNRMELTAAIEALRALKQACDIDLYTDSEYLRKGITQWIEGWKQKDWRNVKNVDLWRRLDDEITRHDIHWHWVKGHAGNKYNERADQLATAAIPRVAQVIDPTAVQVYLQISGAEKSSAGASGWAAAVVLGDQIDYLTGSHPQITPNHLALYATLQALNQIPASNRLQFFCDNGYLFDGITNWVHGWRKGGWIKPEKFNEDWQQLDQVNQSRQIQWFKTLPPVPEIAATLKKLAREARDKLKN